MRGTVLNKAEEDRNKSIPERGAGRTSDGRNNVADSVTKWPVCVCQGK